MFSPGAKVYHFVTRNSHSRSAKGVEMARQGSLELLEDPVATALLDSAIPARLAYTWMDGSPRVVPIWFHSRVSQFGGSEL